MEVVGELYHKLRLAGLDAHLEVRVPSYVHKSGEMRIDIGVLDGEFLIAAIECKREGKKILTKGRQAKAYRELNGLFDVAVFFLNDKTEIDGLVSKIGKLGRAAWSVTAAASLDPVAGKRRMECVITPIPVERAVGITGGQA